MSCVGVLLAGGAARRFGGRPKGLARIGGARIADRVLQALRGATERQVVVANDSRAPAWFPDVDVVHDDTPGRGPLEGIRAALDAAAGAAVIVVAWDMPNVTSALLRELRTRGERGAAAVLPVLGTERRPEPLCAFYAARALPACRALLAAGERRALALSRALDDVDEVGDDVLARFGAPERLMASVDTPEILEALGGTIDDA
jgi:molybdopterin-guanine dinucleotide biosynthesis protein A